MPYDGFATSSSHSVAEMQAALRYLARMMKAQPEAKKLVPVFKALKEQIEVARDADNVFAEALALAGD